MIQRSIVISLLYLLYDCLAQNNNTTTIPRRRFLSSKYHDILGQRREVTVETPSSPEDHLVTNLPLLVEEDSNKLQQYAGLLPASHENDKYFFYWYFLADTTNNNVEDETIPLVIWLNGGPGCSSMDGLFIENGPLEFISDANNRYKLSLRSSSWHKSPAYTVYVDQPVGTGLSFTTRRNYPQNDAEVNRDFATWLEQFIALHANTLLLNGKDVLRPIYFAGESHAGHYIPSMMNYILQPQNKFKYNLNLQGAAIGNGWMDPYHQYAAAEAAYGHGLIDRAQRQALDVKEQACQAQLEKGVYYSHVCLSLLDEIVDQSHGSQAGTKVSQYDVRLVEHTHGKRTFPPNHDLIEAYLGGRNAQLFRNTDITFKTVLEALHSLPSYESGQQYQECTDPPYNALVHQDGLGVTEDVKDLLNTNKVKMLFFNGVMDLICNHVGNEIFLEELEWNHQKDWTQAARYAWVTSFDQNVAGYMKEYNNLLYLKVLESGHMVPMDQPEVSLEMMQTFLYSRSFDSSLQKLQRLAPPSSKDGDSSCPTSQEIAKLLQTKNGSIMPSPIIKTAGTQSSIIWLASIVAIPLLIGFISCCIVRRRRRRQKEQEDLREELSQLELSPQQQYRDDYSDENRKEEAETTVV